MTRTAVVVGGGLGGLAAAHGLTRAGWRVTVYERSAGLPATGTGLGIWPAALKALDRIGLGDAVRAAGRQQPNGVIRRPDGAAIATIDVDKVARRYGEPMCLLSRPALSRVLAEGLPTGTVHFGTPVADPAALRAEYDVVIGADGINSTVRHSIFGATPGLRYSGVLAWRGTVEFDIEAGGETWGRGTKFGLTPQEPGRTNWYAVRPAAEGYEPPGGDLAVLRDLFGGWHDPIPRVLDRVDADTVLRHGLYHLAPLPSYITGNVALLGDAAHAMTPDLGQGACQALIDAVALADALASEADIGSALRRYDGERRPPTQRLAAMSLRASKLAKMRHLLPVRDLLVRGAMAFGPPA